MQGNGYSQYQGAKLCNDIASGKYDATLKKFGNSLARYPNVKYLIRPDYEVSGNLHANTAPNSFDQNTWDTKAYPAAFAHVRQVLKASVPNSQYVYHSVRGGAQALYPGDGVTDYIGFSIFNNDVCMAVGSTNGCQGAQLDPNVLKDIQWAPKPKMVAESAVQTPAGDSGAQFVDYLKRVSGMVEKYDFAGWTYINSNWGQHGWPANTWCDSRIEGNSQALSWWKQNVGGNTRYQFGK